MKVKYKIGLLIIVMGIVSSLYVAQSYALWVSNLAQRTENVVNSGCFSILFEEGTSAIALNNAYPISDGVGLAQTPYTFTITNTCSAKASYTVLLNTINTKTLDDSKIKFAIYDTSLTKPTVGTNLATYGSVASNINTDTANLGVPNLLRSYKLSTGVLEPKDSASNTSKTFSFYLWIDETAGNEIMEQKFEALLNVMARAIQ